MGNALSCLGQGPANSEVRQNPKLSSGGKCSDARQESTAANPPTKQPAPDCVPIKLSGASQEAHPLPDSILSEKGSIPVSEGACCGLGADEDQEQFTGKPWDSKSLGPANPPNNQARTDTGEVLGLPPSPQCAELNLIMRTLCRVFEAPYACMALYYNRQCWITNSWEWPLGAISWKVAACPWNCLVTQPQVLACGELYEDARFHHQPWVDSGLRCYVSAPLLASNGHRMGTVCFLDTVPRRVDAGMCRVLGNFGEIAMRVLERHIELARRLAAAHQEVPHQLQHLVEAAYTGRDVRSWGAPGTDERQGLDEGHWDAGRDPLPAPGAAAEPLPADVLLSSVFARQLRSSEVLKDACTLVVDTGVAGWTVMYADETWKLWSGFSRNELLGCPLQTLLSIATPGVAPLNWAALQREVEEGERFVVPGVVALAPPPPVLSTEAQQHQAPKPPLASVAEASVSVRKPFLTDLQRSLGMTHDQDTAPAGPDAKTARQINTSGNTHTSAVTMSKAASQNISQPGSMIDTCAQATPARRSTEVLLSAVVQHESGRPVLNGKEGQRGASAVARPSGNGVEMWHEAAGVSPFSRNSNNSVSNSTTNATNPTTARLSLASSSPHAVSGGRVFDLSFRPLALDVLDEDALPLGVPSWVPLEACAPMLRLYAVRLHATMAAAQPPQPLTPSVKLTSVRSSTLQQLAGHLFPGLGMGQVLGRGGYGTAYTGTWHDVSVVVKVQDHQLDGMESLRTAQMEVALGQMLRHPHLVRTLGHGAAEVAPSAMPAATPSDPRSQAQTGTGTGIGGNRTDAALTQTQSGTGGAKVLPPSQTSVQSVFNPLSKWLVDSEDAWDGYEADSWFSHCDEGDMIHRNLVTSNRAPEPSLAIAQSVFDQLPPPINFINAVAIAPDVLLPPASTSAHAPLLPSTAEGIEGLDGSTSSEPSGYTAASDSSNNLTLAIIKAIYKEPAAVVVKGDSRNDDQAAGGKAEGSDSEPIHSVPARGVESTRDISYLPVMRAPAPLQPGYKRGRAHTSLWSPAAIPLRLGPPAAVTAAAATRAIGAGQVARLENVLAQVGSHALNGSIGSISGSSSTVTSSSGAKSAPLFDSSKEVAGLPGNDVRATAISARASANNDTTSAEAVLPVGVCNGGGGGGGGEGAMPSLGLLSDTGSGSTPAQSRSLPSAFLLGGGYPLPCTAGASSITSAMVSSPTGAITSSASNPTSQSLSTEMSTMMDSAQRHATHVGAKPMQFPMHLRTFAILEFCDGGTLQDAVDRGWLRKGSIHIDSPIDLSKVVTLASHVACAAAYLHERGVVHADLSAGNVLLCSKRPMVTSGQDSLLTASDNPASTPASTLDSTADSPPDSMMPSTLSKDCIFEWYGKDAVKSHNSSAFGTNTTIDVGEELLYTLPTRRYSLAPSKARSADEFEFVAKVSDFGKSCLLGPEGVIKAGGYATVTHMAPEVLREHLLSPAADVYALGVLMWQMYTGCRPWAGMTHRQILSTVLSGEVNLEWPDEVASGLPEEQREIAARLVALGCTCLAHDAAARPTMAAVHRELTFLCQELA